MVTPQSQARFLKWLDEQIIESQGDAKETADDPNCYGHGYDEGVVRGLKMVKAYFYGDED